MKIFRNLICLSLVAVVAASGVADEKEKKGKGKRERKAPSVTARLLTKIELTEEQKAPVAAIDKQFAERFQALSAKRREILTPEQRKAMQDAQKAAREAKAAGKDAPAAKKPELSDEQKKQQSELNAAQQALNKEVLAALKKVLTEEQVEKLPKRGGGRGANAKKKAGDKPKGEKPAKGKKKKEAADN